MKKFFKFQLNTQIVQHIVFISNQLKIEFLVSLLQKNMQKFRRAGSFRKKIN